MNIINKTIFKSTFLAVGVLAIAPVYASDQNGLDREEPNKIPLKKIRTEIPDPQPVLPSDQGQTDYDVLINTYNFREESKAIPENCRTLEIYFERGTENKPYTKDILFFVSWCLPESLKKLVLNTSELYCEGHNFHGRYDFLSQFINNHKNLIELNLINADIYNSSFEKFEKLEKLSLFTLFSIENNSLTPLASSLKELDIEYDTYEKIGEYLAPLAQFKNLQRFRIFNATLEFKHIQSLPRNLEQLEMYSCTYLTSAALGSLPPHVTLTCGNPVDSDRNDFELSKYVRLYLDYMPKTAKLILIEKKAQHAWSYNTEQEKQYTWSYNADDKDFKCISSPAK